jgi:hypothetical protein
MVSSMNALPWEIYPALTPERLAFVGRLMRSVRAEAADSHEPDKGDTAWGLGTRGHERTIFAITNAAAGIASDWLTVIEPGLHFVFGIGGVPIRFYRGEADSPPTKSLKRNYPEIAAQRQTAFIFPGFEAPARAKDAKEYLLRFAIETDIDGRADRIVLVEVAEDLTTRMIYEVPETSIGYVADTRPKGRGGTELPPPPVSLKSTTKTKKVDDNGED